MPAYNELGMSEPEWEEFLSQMYECIRGDGELNWLHVPGITTYPEDYSPSHRLKHPACLELEKRGLIYREQDFSSAEEVRDRRVVWAIVEGADG